MTQNYALVTVLAAIWTLPWKGVALWRAAKRQELIWFIALLVLNTLAILEIIYIFFFSKREKKPEVKESPAPPAPSAAEGSATEG